MSRILTFCCFFLAGLSLWAQSAGTTHWQFSAGVMPFLVESSQLSFRFVDDSPDANPIEASISIPSMRFAPLLGSGLMFNGWNGIFIEAGAEILASRPGGYLVYGGVGLDVFKNHGTSLRIGSRTSWHQGRTQLARAESPLGYFEIGNRLFDEGPVRAYLTASSMLIQPEITLQHQSRDFGIFLTAGYAYVFRQNLPYLMFRGGVGDEETRQTKKQLYEDNVLELSRDGQPLRQWLANPSGLYFRIGISFPMDERATEPRGPREFAGLY